MEINISQTEFDLIKYKLNLLSNELKIFDSNTILTVKGNKEDFELILDLLADLITEKGINDEGELNVIGFRVEEIIDKISNGMLN